MWKTKIVYFSVVAGNTRSKLEEPTISPEMLKLSTHQNIPSTTSSSQTPASKAISGDDLSADISISSLPERFRRRLLTLEEIEFIEVIILFFHILTRQLVLCRYQCKDGEGRGRA